MQTHTAIADYIQTLVIGQGRYAGQSAAMSEASAYFRDSRLESLACFPELPSPAERGLADGISDLYVQMMKRGELFQAGRRVSDLAALLKHAMDKWGLPAAIVCDRLRSLA